MIYFNECITEESTDISSIDNIMISEAIDIKGKIKKLKDFITQGFNKIVAFIKKIIQKISKLVVGYTATVISAVKIMENVKKLSKMKSNLILAKNVMYGIDVLDMPVDDVITKLRGIMAEYNAYVTGLDLTTSDGDMPALKKEVREKGLDFREKLIAILPYSDKENAGKLATITVADININVIRKAMLASTAAATTKKLYNATLTDIIKSKNVIDGKVSALDNTNGEYINIIIQLTNGIFNMAKNLQLAYSILMHNQDKIFNIILVVLANPPDKVYAKLMEVYHPDEL